MTKLLDILEGMENKSIDVHLIKNDVRELVINKIVSHDGEINNKFLSEVVEITKDAVFNHPVTTLINHYCRDSEFSSVFNYKTYESELVSYAKSEYSNFLESSPDSPMYCKYIDLVIKTGVELTAIKETKAIIEEIANLKKLQTEGSKQCNLFELKKDGNNENFADLLPLLEEAKVMLKLKGITQYEVANHLGCPQSTLSNIVNNPIIKNIDIIKGFINFVFTRHAHKKNKKKETEK